MKNDENIFVFETISVYPRSKMNQRTPIQLERCLYFSKSLCLFFCYFFICFLNFERNTTRYLKNLIFYGIFLI